MLDAGLLTAILPQPALPRYIIEQDLDTRETMETLLHFYTPGHPWYYKWWGPILPAQILPSSMKAYPLGHEKWKKPDVRRRKLTELLEKARQELVTRIRAYDKMRATNGHYLGWIPPWNRNSNSEWRTAMSLMHNHIHYSKCEVRDIQELIDELE